MKNTLVLPGMRGYLDRMIDSPFNSLIDEFFNNSFPTTLIRQDFPKYNIKRLYTEKGEEGIYANGFVIEMALAGWDKDSIQVETEEGMLYVGSKEQETDKAGISNDYFYKGITNQSFLWKMSLPKYAVIKDITFKNGLLSITVKIEVPEEQKRKTFEIK